MSWFSKPEPSPAMAIPAHPHYPLGMTIQGFVANEMSVGELLTIFALGIITLMALPWFLAGKSSKEISRQNKLIILWFALSMKI
jgi:hypothetical protein